MGCVFVCQTIKRQLLLQLPLLLLLAPQPLPQLLNFDILRQNKPGLRINPLTQPLYLLAPALHRQVVLRIRRAADILICLFITRTISLPFLIQVLTKPVILTASRLQAYEIDRLHFFDLFQVTAATGTAQS